MSSKEKNKSKEKDIKSEEKIKIQVNYHEKESSDILNPCLGVFPFNYPNIKIINDPVETVWKLGQNRDRKLINDKSILGINSRIIYESRNKPIMNRNQYILGVINKKRQREIELYDIDTIFNINQKIRKIEKNQNIDEEEDNNGADKNEMMAQLGTAKAKRQAISIKENSVKESNISSINVFKEVLKKKAQEEDLIKNDEEQIQNHLSLFKEILPKFDLTAKNVGNIFEFNSIIENEKIKEIDHKDVLKMLKKNGEGLENNKNLFCEFVYEFLKSLVPKINEGKNLSNKIKYSIYMNELVKFFLLPKLIKENPEKLAQKFTLGEEYVKIMLKNYTKISTDGSGRATYSKSQNLILRNIYHIICLALLLNWFEFDYTSLANSLRINVKKMMAYFREIGCTFKNNSDKNKGKNTVVKLTAPLKLNLKQKNEKIK
jgi:hypothetical protein